MRRGLVHNAALARSRAGVRSVSSVSSTGGYGRTAAYRRIVHGSSPSPAAPRLSFTPPPTSFSPSPFQAILRGSLAPSRSLDRIAANHNRYFSTRSRSRQKAQQPDDVKDRQAAAADERARKASPQQTTDETVESEGAQNQRSSSGKSQSSEQGESGGRKKEDPSKEQKQKKEEAPPPPHGDKTPWQVFMETMRSEFKASKEWNESTQQIAAGYQEIAQSENLRRAQAGWQKGSEAVTGTAGAAIKKTATAVGQGAAWTWETPVVKGLRKGANIVGSGIDKATKPVRETEAFRSVKETIDDGSSSRYGGWSEKEERRRRRLAREAKELEKAGGKRSEPAVEDPDSGTNVTVHKDAAWKEQWRSFRDNSPVMQKLFDMKSQYKESENPLITTARSISDRVAGFFAENETAMVIKKFREMDPGFQIEPFLQEMREYILPEVLDAYVKGDMETLRLWLSTPQFQVYEALMKQYTIAGLKSDGKILDIRHVDILNARLLENEIPVFIITCRTQEVHVYRDIKTGNLSAGMDDKVQLVTYAIGVTRIPEDVSNPETRGWRLIELQKSVRDYM